MSREPGLDSSQTCAAHSNVIGRFFGLRCRERSCYSPDAYSTFTGGKREECAVNGGSISRMTPGPPAVPPSESVRTYLGPERGALFCPFGNPLASVSMGCSC